jgi:hypothetical protein
MGKLGYNGDNLPFRHQHGDTKLRQGDQSTMRDKLNLGYVLFKHWASYGSPLFNKACRSITGNQETQRLEKQTTVWLL